MSEPAKPLPPEYERTREAIRQALTVSKPEILRREAEAMKARRARRRSTQ